MTKPSSRRSRRKAVLIVDDEPTNRMALRAVIESLSLDVVEAESGEEALRSLLARDFALIILDVSLTGIDGIETARCLRQRPRCAATPIVFLTGLADNGRFGSAEVTQPWEFLQKPVEPAVLRDLLRLHLEPRRGRKMHNPPRCATRIGSAVAMDRESLAHGGPLPPSDSESLDIPSMVEKLGGRVEFFKRMALVFLEHAPAQMDHVRGALQSRDGALLAKAAHKIRGAIGMFTTNGPFRVATQLERAAEAGNLAVTTAICESLGTSVDRFSRDLSRFIAKDAQARNGQSPRSRKKGSS